MKHLLLSVILLTGCHPTAKDVATVTANEVREIAVIEHKIITDFCVPRYKGAMTLDEIREIDRKCLPAEVAYMTTKAAWEAMLSVLLAAKKGKATDEDVRTSAEKLGKSLASLQQIVEEME